MNKKKMIITAVSAVFIFIIVTISAIAIMTSISEKSNTLYIGNQTIELSEDKFKISSGDVIKEGKQIDKNPTVKNTGTSPCYIRAYLGFDDESYRDIVSVDIGENWVYGEDGYYYYNSALDPKKSVSFFEHITVQNADFVEFELYVYCESIHTNYKSPSEAWAEFGVNAPKIQD